MYTRERERDSHIREPLGDGRRGNDTTESLDLVVLQSLLEAAAGSHSLCSLLCTVLPLENGEHHQQTFAWGEGVQESHTHHQTLSLSLSTDRP